MRSESRWLIAAAVLTVVMWQLPQGHYIAYPFSIFSTWCHEMGHGLCALLLGGHFDKLMIYENGSGVAHISGPFYWGRIGKSLVAAAGPMGPAIAGAVIIHLASKEIRARGMMIGIAMFMLLSGLIWIRTFFGLGFVILFASALIMTASIGGPVAWRFIVQFLGVQACISTWQQISYLFTNNVVINGEAMSSDSGQIASELFLPYWVWGSLMTVTSLWLLWFSLRSRLKHV